MSNEIPRYFTAILAGAIGVAIIGGQSIAERSVCTTTSPNRRKRQGQDTQARKNGNVIVDGEEGAMPSGKSPYV